MADPREWCVFLRFADGHLRAHRGISETWEQATTAAHAIAGDAAEVIGVVEACDAAFVSQALYALMVADQDATRH